MHAFRKYEGLGNDFLLMDVGAKEERPFTTDQVMQICDRHRGVGADGVLFVGYENNQPFMRIVNADGSEPEMCGNGIRCVVLDLLRRGKIGDGAVTIDTAAGPHRCELVHKGSEPLVRIDMRVASLEMQDLPMEGKGRHIDMPIATLTGGLRFTAISMGNPHVVTFDEVTDPTRLELAPRIERDARFKNRVNVGFARLENSGIQLRVFERGVGWTEACGTGACAAAVAAVETGRAQRHVPIEVTLPGGKLIVEVGDATSPVKMTGPAHFVFEGTLNA